MPRHPTPSDEDLTPKHHPPPPLYLRDNGSSPMHGPTDPRKYFNDPSPLALDICAAHMKETGDHAPYIAVAELAARMYRVEQFRRDTVAAVNTIAGAVDPAQAVATRKLVARVKKYVITAVLAAAGSIGTGAVYILNRTSEHAAQTQKILDDERELERLRNQVDDLRNQLGRRSFDLRPTVDHSYIAPPAAPASLTSKGPTP